MKTLKKWLRDIFDPQDFNDLDISGIASSFNDPSVRIIWLTSCLEEMKRINLEVDKRLLSGEDRGLTDLCARRRAYQDILESALSARRKVVQEVRPNPRVLGIDLDRVTA